MRKQKGFSLIELLIVVAIILIIAAIAIPNLLKSRMAANESSAAANLRTLNTAEITYSTSYSSHGFAEVLGYLGPGDTPPDSKASGLIDSALACDTATAGPCASNTKTVKTGYIYDAACATCGPPVANYVLNAIPQAFQSTGIKAFCSIEDATIRVQPVTASAPTALTHTTCGSTGAL